MGQVRTRGTRAADSEDPLYAEFEDLTEIVRAKLEGPQPGDLKGLLGALPKGWLVFGVVTLLGAMLSMAYVIVSMWSKTDERQDAAIAAQGRTLDAIAREFPEWKSKVNYFIVIAERADRKLDDMREETLREYQAQARDRGDRESVRRLAAKLAAIERGRAKPPGKPEEGS